MCRGLPLGPVLIKYKYDSAYPSGAVKSDDNHEQCLIQKVGGSFMFMWRNDRNRDLFRAGLLFIDFHTPTIGEAAGSSMA